MSGAISLLSVPILPNSAGAGEPPPVTITDAPLQLLAALANGGTVAGTVAAGSDPGTLLLVTAAGDVTLKTALPLPAGTTIALQGRPGAVPGSLGSAVIVTINDVPTSAAPRAPAQAPMPASAVPAAPPAFLDIGTNVVATVIGAAPIPEPQGNAPLPVPAPPPPPSDTKLPPQPLPTDVPALGKPVSPSFLPAQLPATNTLSALGGNPWAATVSPGSNLLLRILALQPPIAASAPFNLGRPDLGLPGAGPPGPGETSATPALLGKVMPPAPAAKGETAAITVETAAGPMRLIGSPNLPANTRVALALLPGNPPAALMTIVTPGEPMPDAAHPQMVSPSVQTAAANMPTAGQATERQATATQLPEQLPARQSPDEPEAAAKQVPGKFGGTMAESGPFPHETRGAAAPGGEPVPPGKITIERPSYRVLLAPAEAPATLAASDRPIIPRFMTGTVLADRAAAGAASLLVETPLGLLAVSPRLAAPPGSLLLLAAPDLPLGSDARDAAAGPDHGWSSLPSALAALGHAAPALASMLRADLSPQAGGERLAASFLLIIAALRGPVPWPGEAVERALTGAGREDSKTSLIGALSDARRIAAQPATDPWQVFLMPLVDGNHALPLKLYLKRDPGRRGSRPQDENARFVLEFELTRLGAIQLDGFVRRQRFDLILRGLKPLGAALEGAVERIFHDRIAAAGYAGTIDFSTVPRFEIAPLDQLRGHVGLAV